MLCEWFRDRAMEIRDFWREMNWTESERSLRREWILRVLFRDGPLTSYEIARAVRKASGGRVSLLIGTIMPELDLLVNWGAIEPVRQVSNDEIPRCYYSLTGLMDSVDESEREAIA